jgi:hypothetical protein
MEEGCLFTHLGRDLDAVAKEHALITGTVGNDLQIRSDVAIAFDEAADGGGETGRQASSGEQRDFLLGHFPSLSAPGAITFRLR